MTTLIAGIINTSNSKTNTTTNCVNDSSPTNSSNYSSTTNTTQELNALISLNSPSTINNYYSSVTLSLSTITKYSDGKEEKRKMTEAQGHTPISTHAVYTRWNSHSRDSSVLTSTPRPSDNTLWEPASSAFNETEISDQTTNVFTTDTIHTASSHLSSSSLFAEGVSSSHTVTPDLYNTSNVGRAEETEDARETSDDGTTGSTYDWMTLRKAA